MGNERGNGGNIGLWSTSNPWATAGMVRVLATINKWERVAYNQGRWAEEREKPVKYVKEVLDRAMQADKDGSPPHLRNNLDDPLSSGEAAGTALLTSTVYRIAVLEPEVFGKMYLDWADATHDAVIACVDSATGLVMHVVDWSNFRDWKMSKEGHQKHRPLPS